MEIVRVKTGRLEVDFESGRRWNANRVDLLTGPNGSGKTEVLTTLANYFGFSGGSQPSKQVEWRNGGSQDNTVISSIAEPIRVVAQTFSPFNRFRAPKDTNDALTEIYSDRLRADSRYICVGLHQSYRLVGSGVAKRTLEQALYRMSEAPKSAVAISHVLGSLGFQPGINLQYQVRGPLLDFVHRGAPAVEEWLTHEQQSIGTSLPRAGIRGELLRSSRDSIAELILTAVDIVRRDLQGRKTLERHFDFGRYESTMDFAELQSLAVLRRLDLLTLKACELQSSDGSLLDVASASSGQQQMLCSVSRGNAPRGVRDSCGR